MNRAQYLAARRAYRDALSALVCNAEDRTYGYGGHMTHHYVRDVERAEAALPGARGSSHLSWWQCMRDRRHCVERSIKRVHEAEALRGEVAGDPRGEAMLALSIARHRRVVRAYLKPLKEGYSNV
ncbi:MAG TPA: hypothetical protein VJ833_09910 [Rhodanobacteraceae bacterium]|nr:hypothetical protein [Rhodanobacteraceae bacterium]